MDAELITIVSDIFIIVSAAVVAVVAIFGLCTWRKELTGKAKFESARDVILLSFRLRRNFQRARNPFTSSLESSDRPRREDESQNESRVLDESHAKNRRLQPLIEDLQKLEEAGWRAEILLDKSAGEEVSAAVKAFWHYYAELSSAIESYFETTYREAITNSVYQDQEWLKELKKIIYSAGGDDFSKEIDEVTDKLASTLRPYVK